ncbi:MAG: hypothetical protein A4E27_01412 [Methanobacterium sp. PtaU1.Bin242]|nr:MAG: hypothetical protein A4E27_01412 [Methanobacterium sp. PtaU1.Bin242]
MKFAGTILIVCSFSDLLMKKRYLKLIMKKLVRNQLMVKK